MSIARSTALIGSGTIASRLLGFARDVLVARLFGAGPVADALLVALRLPNLFRRVLGEGGLNAGLVPAYARLKAQDGEAAAGRFAGAALANLALGLLLLVGLCHMAAPWIVLVLSGGGFDGAAPPAGAAAYLRAALPFVAGATLASALPPGSRRSAASPPPLSRRSRSMLSSSPRSSWWNARDFLPAGRLCSSPPPGASPASCSWP